MEISIVIVNYNTKKLTLQCVESIRKFNPKVSHEIIVIDNGSDEPIPTSKHYRLIKNNKNLGFAKANNQGIKIAKGNYVLLLNSDTQVTKGAIDELYNFAETRKDVGVVGVKLLNSDGTVQGSVFRLPSLWRTIRQYFFGERKLLDKYTPAKTSEVEAVSMAAFLITPVALKKVGVLDERYFMYFEDLDYCRRVKKLGLKIIFLSDSEVIHHHGASGKSLAESSNQWKRLIPSSKTYFGPTLHYINFFISWLGQKIGNFFPFALLTLLCLPAIWNLLRPGFFPMQDDLQAFRVYEMDRCFDDWQIPCRWVPDAGYQYGYPQFNFYPPLPYYLGAVLHRVGFQYIDAVKVLFVLGYILSAATMYVLVRSLVGKWDGLMAGLLYTYIPYKAVEVYVRGALNEFWAQIFFPLIFWAIYKLIKTGKLKYLIWLSLSTAFLATTHSLMTMIFAPIAVLWAVYWLLSEKWGNLFKIIWAGVLGFGLSAFFTLPLIFERKFAHIDSLLSGYFDYRQHFVSLYKLFLSMEWGYGSSGFPDEKLNLSLGIIQWIVGIGAVIFAFINFKKSKKISILTLLLSGMALFSIFMMHMKSSFIWVKLPFLWYLQFPWRFLAISIFLLCLLAGLFMHFTRRFKYILGIILVTASVILSISFFVPKDWLNITDTEKFSGISWEKQLTVSIFDYLPIYGVLPPWSKAPEFPEVLEGDIKFLEYKKGSNFQTGEVEAKKDSLIRIPLFDFPGMEVKIDGEKVKHVNNDCRNERYCRGLITFSVAEGKHRVEIRLEDTPIRKIGNALTVISLGALGYLVLKLRRQ